MKLGGSQQCPGRRASIVCLALVAAVGCVSRDHRPYLGLGPRPTIRSARLAPATTPPGVDLRPLPSDPAATHRRWGLSVPSVTAREQAGAVIEATFHQARSGGVHRLVVVLPIWGKSSYPQRQIVQELTRGRRGPRTHVLAIHGREALFDWDAMAASPDEETFVAEVRRAGRALADAATDVRRVLDWATTWPEVDPSRLGVVGFSMGAVAASLLAGTDERLSATVSVMGGAHLHQVFASCRGDAGPVRRRIMRRFGWTREEFERRIEEPLAAVDPTRYAHSIDPWRLLIIDAAYDHCMPETGREDLWQAAGRPERISLRYGHKLAFLSMTPLGFRYTTRAVIGFLNQRLPVAPADALTSPRPRLARPQPEIAPSAVAGGATQPR